MSLDSAIVLQRYSPFLFRFNHGSQCQININKWNQSLLFPMWLVHMVLVFLLHKLSIGCFHALKQSYITAYAVIAYTYGTLHITEVLRKP